MGDSPPSKEGSTVGEGGPRTQPGTNELGRQAPVTLAADYQWVAAPETGVLPGGSWPDCLCAGQPPIPRNSAAQTDPQA